MLLIAYINGAAPSYQLHTLNLITLADRIAPVTVAASQTLTDGTLRAVSVTRAKPGYGAWPTDQR